MFDSSVFLPLSTRAYFKGRAYIKIILKNNARSYFASRSYYRGNTVAVSLSSLMTGKQDDTDDDIVAEGELKQDKRQLLPDTHEEKQEIKRYRRQFSILIRL